MSRELVESILSKNMLEANDMVENQLAQIRERKMYEMKRMYAAKLDEVLGGKDPAELRAKGYRKATDVLGLSPYDKRKERAKEREAKGKKARKAAPTPKETKPAVYQRPGMIKRNINTLMGREPGYVDDRTPEEKLKQKGGRVGKFARGVGDTLRSTVGSGLD